MQRPIEHVPTREVEGKVVAFRRRPPSDYTPRSPGFVPGRHQTAKASIKSPADATPTKSKLVIWAGTGDDQKVFHVESSILSEASAYVRSYLLSSRISLKSEEIGLPSEDPTAVTMLVDWAKMPKKPITYAPGQYSTEPWISHAAAAWVLGQHLNAPGFQRYALSQFIQNCAMMIEGPWELIEDKTFPKAPLRRFSNHWVIWNCLLFGVVPPEYAGLKAVELARHAAMVTHDPRTFDLEHWYMHCGDQFDARCTHDPLVRQIQQDCERIRHQKPPAEWGQDWERAASTRR